MTFLTDAAQDHRFLPDTFSSGVILQGHRIGYVRVSSFDQNPERQLEQVQVDKVFTDKASGKDTQRPQLDALLGFVREGDTVVVHSMDRLARNLDDLRRLVQSLTQRGVRIEFVKEHLTFTGEDSPMANLMLSVMGAFAEFERALIRSPAGVTNGTPTTRLAKPVLAYDFFRFLRRPLTRPCLNAACDCAITNALKQQSRFATWGCSPTPRHSYDRSSIS